MAKHPSGKWVTLRHNGPFFPSEYEPHNLAINVSGQRIPLNREQEESAYAWAKKIGTPYAQDPVFCRNFFEDFVKLFPGGLGVDSMSDVDFSETLKFQEKEKQDRLNPEVRKRQAKERKARREKLKDQFGYAWIDGRKTEIANWMVEPPCIFMGRGAHPLRGHWKPRVYSEDVTLNLDEKAPHPPGRWSQIVHDHNSMWLAFWVDKLGDVRKYVWLSDAAPIRHERDKAKYDLAAKLNGKVERIRKHIRKGMASRDLKLRKTATVCYLIDNLAMRVGDEKDEDEADTVGASTLRVEHITLTPHSINFDFLGKDSVRWQKNIDVAAADEIVVENIKRFTKGKRPGDLLFDGVSSAAVNRYLGQAMVGCTAKVFRTYHATRETESYLRKRDRFSRGTTEFAKLYHAKMANLRAAVRCNHKRTPPKNWQESLTKKEERLRSLRHQQAKTEKAAARLEERQNRLKLQVQLTKETRDYNLNTSLRNYIDPRTYRGWADKVGLDWRLIYTKALQRKFAWVSRFHPKW